MKWSRSTPYTRRSSEHNGIPSWAIADYVFAQHYTAACTVQQWYRRRRQRRAAMATRLQQWWRRNPSSFCIL